MRPYLMSVFALFIGIALAMLCWTAVDGIKGTWAFAILLAVSSMMWAASAGIEPFAKWLLVWPDKQ